MAVGEHLLDVPHDRLKAFGDVEHLGGAGLLGQLLGHVLDDLVARVGHGVDGVAKADDNFAGFDAAADVGFGLVRRFIALLHIERHFVGAAMLRAAQRADGAGNRREHVRTRAGDDACRERGRVELVLGVQVQGDVHRLDPFVAGLFAVQQVQEVAADAVVVRLHVDDAAVVAVVVPVQQGRTQVGHQAVGDVARARGVVIVFLGQHAAQHRHGGAHDVHRVARGGQGFQRDLQLGRQAAQALQLLLVGGEFGLVGQFAMDEQPR
ncbi:hypothetical protein G6F35_012806 [Rhizopus arrhizus]|nr:hypothetical protein G6F35_012806 [Rhizopus arrhizus]